MFDHYGSYSSRPFFLESSSSSSPFAPINRGRDALYSVPTYMQKERLAKQRALRQAALEREEEDRRRELQMQRPIQKQREEEQRKRIMQKMEMRRARLAAQKEKQKRQERLIQTQRQHSESGGNSRSKFGTKIVQGSDGNLYRIRVPVTSTSNGPRVTDQSSSSKLSGKAVAEDKAVAEREALAKKSSSERSLTKEENVASEEEKVVSEKRAAAKKGKKDRKAAKRALRHDAASAKVSEKVPAQENSTPSPQDRSQQEMEWEEVEALLQPNQARLVAQKEKQKRQERLIQSQLQHSESGGNSRSKLGTEIVQGTDGNLYRVRVPVTSTSNGPRITDPSSSSKLSGKAVAEDKTVAEREALAKKPSSERSLTKEEKVVSEEEKVVSEKRAAAKKGKKDRKAAKRALRHDAASAKVSEKVPAQENSTPPPQDRSQQEMEWEEVEAEASLQPNQSSSNEEEEKDLSFIDRKSDDANARKRKTQKKRRKMIVQVEDASDDDEEYSFANNLVPGAGESWMEPVGRT